MNKAMFTASLIAGAIAIPAAHAQERDGNPTGVYLGANLGYAHYDDDDVNEFGVGASIGFQVGYRWSEHVRTELELSGSAAELKDSVDEDDTLGFGSLSLNAFYDFLPTSRPFVPYVGAGVGTATVVVDVDGEEDADGGLLSLHGEAGLALNVNEHFAIVPSYRYTWVDDDTDLLDDDLTSHAFRVGARLSF